MSKRFHALILVCLSMLFSASWAATVPNVVFILTDDLGVNDLACYGRKEHKTPNLDKLAREGMRFTSAYCAQPICSPSRAALLTGKAPARLQLTTYLPGRPDAPSQKLLHPKMRQALPAEEKTFAEVLGFTSGPRIFTGWIGKWHLGGKGFLPTDQGFDFFYEGKANTEPSETEGGKGEFDLTRQAEEFLEQHQKEPFILFLSHNSPHIAYKAKKELVENNKDAFEPVYAAVLESLDQSVGQLLRKIDALGLRDNTVVIFTSDNGGLHVPEGGHRKVTHNRPFRAGKGFVYEGGLRIPLIVRWPGKIRAGSVTDIPVVNTDWMSTLVEIAGRYRINNLDGQSMMPIFEGEPRDRRRRFFWHFPHYTNQGGSPAGAIRDGDWKLIEHYEDGRIELFNLENDPGEKTDLSKVEEQRVGKMRADFHQWLGFVQAQTNSPNPEFNAELHRAIYKDFDITRYDPPAADEAEFARVLQWRTRMNEAVRSRR